MPLIAGRFNSIGPAGISMGCAPNSSARRNACCESLTRNAMPHAEGPCSAAKYEATLLGSRFTMKLMAPWRYSATSFDRWSATLVNPSISNTGSMTLGVGEANSTNSKPMSPIGFSNRSAIAVFLLMNVVAKLWCGGMRVRGFGPRRVSVRNVLETPARGLRTEQSDRAHHHEITRRDRHEDANHAEVAQEERDQESRKSRADTAERVHQSARAGPHSGWEDLRLVGVVAHGQQLPRQANQDPEGDDQGSDAELREQRAR